MELENTIRGLRNLQTTYDGDITIRSKLDVHIENVTNKFNSIRQRLEQQLPVDGLVGGARADRCHADRAWFEMQHGADAVVARYEERMRSQTIVEDRQASCDEGL